MLEPTLFDYNGVLVDDEHVHFQAFLDVLGPMGVDLSFDRYVERYLGYDDVGAFRAILGDLGRPPSDAEVARLVDRKRPCYRKRAEASLRVFEGAVALVRARAQKGPVGIVSGALREEIELGLGRMGVRDEVLFIVSAEDTRRGKPDPEGYQLGIAKLVPPIGAEAARCTIVVEDSLAGVVAAKAAGLGCAAVTHSYSEAQLRNAGADLVVSSLAELAKADLHALACEVARRLRGVEGTQT